jgi:acetyl esterase/lipase
LCSGKTGRRIAIGPAGGKNRKIMEKYIIICLMLSSSMNAFAGAPGSLPGGSFGLKISKDVPYGLSSEEKADLYLLPGENNPAIIFVHGGAWCAGDKSTYASYYAKKYYSAGISAIAINYRLGKVGDPSTYWPAQLQDAQLAVRWAKANARKFGIDPDRICAFGDSAGGHLAIFLAARTTSQPGDRSGLYSDMSPSVSCAVNMFGPSDLTDSRQLEALNSLAIFGGRSYAQDPGPYGDASPIRAINGRSAPILTIQGTKDPIVPPSQADMLSRKMKEVSVPNPVIRFNAGHWFDGLPTSRKNAIDDQAVSFVRGYLRPR